MEYLINMNRRLRIVLLYSLFIILIPIGVFLDSVIIAMSSFIPLGLLIYTNIEYTNKKRSSLDDSLEQTLAKHKFESDQSYLSHDYLSGIAFNEDSRKVAILHRNSQNEDFSFKLINFTDIIESSISEDEITVNKSSKGGIIGGTLIGGALAGGVGAVIGGLSGNKTSTEKVSKLTLTITIDELTNPIYYINFLNSHTPIEKESKLYNLTSRQIENWHGIISVILKRNELNTKTV